MLYNLRVRHNFLIIVNDNGMGKKAGKSLWSDNVHEHGVREYGAIAKAKGLSARDGAFFCFWKCLEDWEKIPYSEKKEYPDLLTSNLYGAVRQMREPGLLLHQADQSYKKTNPREPESILTAKSEILFISKLLAMVSIRMISTLITQEQLVK